MKKIFDLFADPVFWVSAVVVGFCINIFSAYAKERIDNYANQWTVSRRRKKESREAQVARMAKALKGQLEERMHLQFLYDERRRVSRAMEVISAALFAFACGAALHSDWWVAGIFSLISAWIYWEGRKVDAEMRFMKDVLRLSIEDSPFWDSWKPTATPASNANEAPKELSN